MLPQAAELPHAAELPQAAELPHNAGAVVRPGRNTVVPQTAEGTQSALLHQIDPEFGTRKARLRDRSYVTLGDAAEPFAV